MNSPTAAASVKEERFARVFDREIAPVWHDRFSRMIIRSLASVPRPPSEGRFVLDVHAHTGRTTSELLHRLEPQSRVLAIEEQPAQISVAKSKIRPEWKKRVYFKEGDFDDVTEMDDATYDLTVANLVLGEVVADWRTAIGELVRVTKPGGVVLASLPLYGTWREVEDLFEEVLRDGGRRDAIQTLNRLRRMRPRPKALADACEAVQLDETDYVIEHERFELLFRSGREFLFSPVIEHGPLRLWRAVLGDRSAQDQQKIFWSLKEAIDTYYAKRVLATTVVAGLIQIRVPGPGVTGNFSQLHWSRYPSLDRVFRGNASLPGLDKLPATGSGPLLTDDDDDDDFDLDLDLEDDGEDVDIDVEVGNAIGTGPSETREPERPKTAAQSLVDMQILDAEDLDAGAGADETGGFDPSQPLAASGVPGSVDKVDTDELFNDKDTGSFVPVPGGAAPPPDLDDEEGAQRAASDLDVFAGIDDELIGDEFDLADDMLEEVATSEDDPDPSASSSGANRTLPPPPKPKAAPKKKLKLPPLPKKK